MHPLKTMLKNDPPPWGSSQMKAVQLLKQKLQSLPLLQIPSNGKRILQTDADDKYWVVVILEEQADGKRRICGHKSGRFS